MRQVAQNLKTGVTELADVPTPLCRPSHLLIATCCSLISAGTERMVVDFAEKALLQKACSHPNFVRQTLDVAQRKGWLVCRTV